MNKPSILKSVSISEMLHMREMGLSNAEIADKIGCSHAAVIRYIGKASFRKSRGDNRKAEPLPPVGDRPIPEMPHKSFAQRLEESYKKPAPVGNVEIPETVKEDIERKLEAGVVPQQPLRPADLAREAHMKELEKTSTPYTTYKEEASRIPELIAMFGPDAVIAWLKVSLYDMGIPDCRPMNRQKMLEMLKIMNAGGANA